MASLLVSAAVNIAVGLLINSIFPPPDIQQEGPRLTELGFTSAAYGKFVNVVFGTDRIAGNIIDATDPAIEEIVSTESTSAGGKGGGQTVNTTTYTYFLTCRIAWCIEGADTIIRWWGDGKLIYDATGTSQFLKSGVTMTFYPGGIDQIQDPEEVVRRGSNIPAYGHLTTLKVDRMPLADFGNRIPNFTAEIAFASTTNNPFLALTEPSGLDVPGSLSGADVSFMSFNPDRNELYSLKSSPAGSWVVDASTMTFKTLTGGDGGFSEPVVGRDGFYYGGIGTSNSSRLQKFDVETGTLVAEFVGPHNHLTDDAENYGNSGLWYQLSAAVPGAGIKSTVFHMNTGFGTANGSVTDPDLIGVATPIVHVFSTTDGFPSETMSGFGMPDHERGRFFMLLVNTANNSYDLFKVIPTFSVGTSGYALDSVIVTTVKQFTRGTFAAGNDFEGVGTLTGWALNDANGDLMMCNGTSIVLYNPDSNTVLAQLLNGNLAGRNNYYSGSTFGFGTGGTSGGNFFLVDTRTLEILKTIDVGDVGLTGNEVLHDESLVWDDRVQALMLSRVDIGSDASVGQRIVKVFLNRVGAAGVGLDTVVSALSTSYQRQTMAGLDAADIDVTTLAGDTVQGYTLNRQSTMKSALQPLRDRFLFDAHQSDWIIKFPKRGATPTVTIPEQDVGILKRGRSQTDEPAVREIRQDDLSLPMSLSVRYRNKDIDYQVDVERDKRHLFPNPTMRSKSERTLDIPLVEQPTAMKQLAQKTLLTLWNERVSYKTIVPWTYLKLDATDVFNMGVFNETHQLRMAENDFGQGWAIDLTGVVEDTKSFSSTLAGAAGLGHVGTVVPSSLPTRLTPLDAPILSLEDLLFTALSNAYMAVGAFEAGWPGASVLKSLDNVAYTSTGSVTQEAAIGRVQTAPSAWGRIEGDFRNRFQEVADGGTMVIIPLRRADEWVTTTETLVLSGANTVAVIRASDAAVEILNFQNATLNDDNTVTLTKLLRGRLGTEDIVDLGITANDTVILLSNAANVKEAGPIIKQALTLSELDTSLFFKGVTIGTLIEDAPVTSATYTGRDIKPYSVAGIAASGAVGADLTITWNRRTRGPLAAEWLDGTGVTPIGESIEQYIVTIADGIASDVVKTVNDAETVTFTIAELSALTPQFTMDCRMVSGVSSAILSPSVLKDVYTPIIGIRPTLVGTETTATAGTTLTAVVTIPAGTLDGHVMIATAAWDGGTINLPAGWNLLWRRRGNPTGQTSGSDIEKASSAAWYKVAASEGSDVTFTVTEGSVQEGIAAAVMTYQDAGIPTVSANQFQDSDTSTHEAPSIDVPLNNSVLLCLATSGRGNGSYTPPSGMTEQYDHESASGFAGVTASVATEPIGAGVTGTRDFTYSDSRNYACGTLEVPPIVTFA